METDHKLQHKQRPTDHQIMTIHVIDAGDHMLRMSADSRQQLVIVVGSWDTQAGCAQQLRRKSTTTTTHVSTTTPTTTTIIFVQDHNNNKLEGRKPLVEFSL